MEVRVGHLGDAQFEITARGHRVYCDQPAEAGGYDEGMTPPEFFLAAVGACAGYYAAQYLRAAQLPEPGLEVRVSASKAKAPARLEDLRISIHYPHALEARHQEGLRAAAQRCLIHNTLRHPPRITTEVLAPAAKTPARAA
jgi:uncharacterized OsmC-like protein